VQTAADPWNALGDPTRRGILARVAARPSSVTELAQGLPVSRPAVSQHLHVLLQAGLVDVQPVGRHRVYTARPDGLAGLRADLDRFWSQALGNFRHLAETSYQEQR
jgi:DNA-binding transcriptional ArsR family regulator